MSCFGIRGNDRLTRRRLFGRRDTTVDSASQAHEEVSIRCLPPYVPHASQTVRQSLLCVCDESYRCLRSDYLMYTFMQMPVQRLLLTSLTCSPVSCLLLDSSLDHKNMRNMNAYALLLPPPSPPPLVSPPKSASLPLHRRSPVDQNSRPVILCQETGLQILEWKACCSPATA